MSMTKQKSVIRSRLKDGKALTGIEVQAASDKNIIGLLDAMQEMFAKGEVERNDDGKYCLPSPRQARWEYDALPSAEEVEALCRGLPNTMVVIGSMSDHTCYLNITIDEALERVRAKDTDGELPYGTVQLIAFHDTLSAYSISTP